MDKDGDGFPDLKECIMIFGGSNAVYSKCQHKVRYREACVSKMAIPSYLRWSESLITFDQRDIHPTSLDQDATRSLSTPLFARSTSPRC